MSVTSLRQERPVSGNVVRLERLSTKALLIDTGERLYGQHGFNGISLREIATVAGQRNCNAVQYHFKNKQEFVSAILRDRVFQLDRQRAELFTELQRQSGQGPYDPRDLLKVLWLPDLSMIGPDGMHTYIRFSLQYYLQPGAGAHPFYTADGYTKEGAASCLSRVNDLLKEHFSNLREETFGRRILVVSMMYQCSVVQYDNEQLLTKRKSRPAFDIEAIIDMAIGSLAAPD